MTVEDERTPRWVKVAGIVAAVLLVLLIVVLATGGHGPGRHASAPQAAALAAGA